MRIVFMGTPEFALPSLEMLIARGDSLTVFTQPDRPKDRGHGISASPVKKMAVENGIPVFQIEKIRSDEGVSKLKEIAPELMVTAAFGQILSAENLEIPQFGCINVHGSLLPRYRGAAPIQWAVINGEKTTGVTTMLTNVGLDTGDILAQKETDIYPDETAGELYARLAVMGAELLKQTIESLQAGTLQRTPQDDDKATMCRTIKKEMARIDFSKSAAEVHNLVRGMNPAPAAFTVCDGAMLKVYKTIPHLELDEQFAAAEQGECVIADAKHGLYVKCGIGVIEVRELQFAGTKQMSAAAALNSRKMYGRILGL